MHYLHLYKHQITTKINYHMLRRNIIFISLLLIPFVSLSQDKVWGMQDCILYALEHNIGVQQTQLNADVQKINLDQSKYSQLPSLNASASHSYNFGRTADPTTNIFSNREIQSTNLSLNGNVVIFNGFSLRKQIKQNNFEYLAGIEDVERTKNDLSLNVAAAYLQVVYAQEAVTQTQNRLKSAQESRDRTKKLVDAGSIAMGSLFDEESAVATEELNLVQADINLSIAIIDLTQLMDLDYDPDFKVESPKVELPDQSSLALPTDEIYGVALETLPVVRFSNYKVQSAEMGLASQKGARIPRLSLFGSLNSRYSSLSKHVTAINDIGLQPNGNVTTGGDNVLSPSAEFEFDKTEFVDQLDNNYNESFGFSLSVPIFNGRTTEANIQRSEIGLANAKYNLELTHDQLYKNVVLAHTNAKSAQKKYSAAERNDVALKESFKYAEKRYNLGSLSSIEFLKARDNRDQAESDFLQAKYELIFRIKALDFYLGRPLTF
jgi:outer membrane protein